MARCARVSITDWAGSDGVRGTWSSDGCKIIQAQRWDGKEGSWAAAVCVWGIRVEESGVRLLHRRGRAGSFRVKVIVLSFRYRPPFSISRVFFPLSRSTNQRVQTADRLFPTPAACLGPCALIVPVGHPPTSIILFALVTKNNSRAIRDIRLRLQIQRSQSVRRHSTRQNSLAVIRRDSSGIPGDTLSARGPRRKNQPGEETRVSDMTPHFPLFWVTTKSVRLSKQPRRART